MPQNGQRTARTLAQGRSGFDGLAGTSGGRGVSTLDPYHLFGRGEADYLVAWCHDHLDTRIFALDRFTEATLLDEHFESFGKPWIEAHLAHAEEIDSDAGQHDVVAEFDADQRRRLRSEARHPLARVTERSDGLLELSARIADLEGFARWLVSFAGKARVVEPQALIVLLGLHAYALSSRYDEPVSPAELREAFAPVADALGHGFEPERLLGADLLARLMSTPLADLTSGDAGLRPEDEVALAAGEFDDDLEGDESEPDPEPDEPEPVH